MYARLTDCERYLPDDCALLCHPATKVVAVLSDTLNGSSP